jgi:hypothetical protein
MLGTEVPASGHSRETAAQLASESKTAVEIGARTIPAVKDSIIRLARALRPATGALDPACPKKAFQEI